jgi:hypothetical protein
MAKIVRDPVTGLTPQQEAFTVGLAKGYSQSDAYRSAYNVKPTTTAESVHVSASRMAKRPNVQSRVRQLLSEVRIADIDNVGQAWRDLLDIYEDARDEKNYNAAAQLMRQRLTGLGALKHDFPITHHRTLTDEQIVKRLAGDDERMAAMLRSIIVPDSFDEPVRH